MLVPSRLRPQRRHVGHLRRGHQQHPGPRPRRHREIGHLADLLRRGAWRQRPADLEPQLGQRPHRVMPLHLRHRDPRRHRLHVLIDHRDRDATRTPPHHGAPGTARSSPSPRSAPPTRPAVRPRRRPRRLCRGSCGPADFGRRVIAAACWSISQRVRLDGGCPYLRSYAAAIRSSSGVSPAVRDENRSMTCCDTPPISQPLPSCAGHHRIPPGDQPGLPSPGPPAPRSTAAGYAGPGYPAAGTSHPPPSARCTRFAIAMWTCSCGSPSRLM